MNGILNPVLGQVLAPNRALTNSLIVELFDLYFKDILTEKFYI